MTQAIKAALLSALTYPGVGHFVLKKHRIGAIFAGVFSIFFVLTLVDVFAVAQCIANDIVAGRVGASYADISAAVKQPSAHCAALVQYRYLYIMGIIWLFSVADAYRLGRKAKHTTA
ncbi:hypothetical protein [Pseudoalteromonas sp.]|jgi:hypothetical protein|uniref:hypothetical protein n=1 Tax=Pseudoalteromonas sp. TaxID=53249 RepID=UPI0035652A7C